MVNFLKQTEVSNLRKNKITLEDSWFGFGKHNHFSFFEVNEAYSYISSPEISKQEKKAYFENFFVEDEVIVSQKRTALSLFMVLSEIGGAIEVITIAIIFFIGYF